MAALFKVSHAIKQAYLPGIPNFSGINPDIEWDGQCVNLSATNQPWAVSAESETTCSKRHAIINSYGFGGVNAAVVIEEPAHSKVATLQSEEESHCSKFLLILSAKDDASLLCMAKELLNQLSEQPIFSVEQLTYSLQVRRTEFSVRWAQIVKDQTSTILALKTLVLAIDSMDEVLTCEAQPLSEHELERALQEPSLETLKSAWLAGQSIPWQRLYEKPRLPLKLPRYPFHQHVHWLPKKKTVSVKNHSTNIQETTEAGTLIEQVAGCLGLSISDLKKHRDRPLVELGLHSLGAVGLKSALQHLLGKPLSLRDVSPQLSLSDLEAKFSEGLKNSVNTNPCVVSTDIENRYAPFPLNEIQASFFSGRQMLDEAERVGCHMYFEIDWQRLDIYRLNQAWQKLIDQHDMLRMTFDSSGLQRIQPKLNYRVKSRDLRRFDDEECTQQLRQIRSSMSHNVFSDGQCPLFELRVSKISDEWSRIHFSIDELVVDANSVECLLQQWRTLYEDPNALLPSTGCEFRDIALYQSSQENVDLQQNDLAYWMEKIQRLPKGLRLSSKQALSSSERRRLDASLSESDWALLKRAAEQSQVSGTVLLLSVFGWVLKQVHPSHFSLISTLYNRPSNIEHVEDILGPMISTCFLGIEMESEDSWQAVLKRNQAELLSALDHSSLSGIRIVREAKRQAEDSDYSLSEVVFTSLLNNPVVDRAPSFSEGQTYAVTQTPQVYLDHQLKEVKGSLYLSWDYAVAAYPESFIQGLFESYVQLLKALATSKDWLKLPLSSFQSVRLLNTKEENASTALQKPEIRKVRLTDQQQAYAFNRMLHLEKGSSHLYISVDIKSFDLQAFNEAWNTLVERHDMLRTQMTAQGTQRILSSDNRIEISELSADLDQASIEQGMLSNAAPIGQWPSTQIGLQSLGKGCVRFHLCTDLMTVDLASRDRLVEELFKLYQGETLPDLPAKVEDHIDCLYRYLDSPQATESLQHWRSRFMGLPNAPFPIGETETFDIHSSLSARITCWPKLVQQAKTEGVSLDALLLTAYAWAIGLHTQNQAFSIVAPGWDRSAFPKSAQPLIGDFTQLSWIPCYPYKKNFLDSVKTCDQIFIEDQPHACMSGLQVLRKLGVDQSTTQALTFPIVFTRLNPLGPVKLPKSATFGHFSSRTYGVILDNLSLESNNELWVRWDIATGSLSLEQAETMFHSYCELLSLISRKNAYWKLDLFKISKALLD